MPESAKQESQALRSLIGSLTFFTLLEGILLDYAIGEPLFSLFSLLE